MPKTKKPRRHQKLTAGRTKVSRRARYIRRKFFATQIELEFLRANPKATTPAELSRVEKRYASIEAQFKGLPKLARRLEVPAAVALAELDGDDEGEEE